MTMCLCQLCLPCHTPEDKHFLWQMQSSYMEDMGFQIDSHNKELEVAGKRGFPYSSPSKPALPGRAELRLDYLPRKRFKPQIINNIKVG
nr:hypothetical protein Iba_chr02fCG4790 [Ipomoea batatas]GMC81008.1 hypothetical protein Iba_scaffold35218CG0010 [Ipomoea batatas]